MKSKLMALAFLFLSQSVMATRLSDIGWLQGYWYSDSPAGFYEMSFSPPSGNMILAYAKLSNLNQKTTDFFEFIQIQSTETGYLLTPYPFGKPGVLFKGIMSGKYKLQFSNPENNFPRLITYEVIDGTLLLTAEGIQNNKPVKMQFMLRKR